MGTCGKVSIVHSVHIDLCRGLMPHKKIDLSFQPNERYLHVPHPYKHPALGAGFSGTPFSSTSPTREGSYTPLSRVPYPKIYTYAIMYICVKDCTYVRVYASLK